MYCVYYIYDTIDDEVIYVGSTSRFARRRQNYTVPSADRKHPVVRYMRQFNDWQTRFEIEKLKEFESDNGMKVAEKEFIHDFMPRCNIQCNKQAYIIRNPQITT